VLRYYVVATLIVVAIGSALVTQRLMSRVEHRDSARALPVPATSSNANAGFVATPQPYFVGQGGWVLSALPSCFTQRSSTQGPTALLGREIPQDALRIVPGTTLRSGSCTVLVRPHDIWVYRGGDRLRVPPEARLYHGPQGLTLVYQHAGRTEVRVY
jgi:hypothetical protein